MRYKAAALFLLVIALVGMSAACFDDKEPVIKHENETPYARTVPTFELSHVAWIPIQNNDLTNLFRDIDKWVAEHPRTEIITVNVINSTVKNHGSNASYTIPSGALIVFR